MTRDTDGCYLGIDVGTSATRVSLVNEEGSIVANASVSYPSYRREGGIVEQDPGEWLDALAAALNRIGIAHRPLTGIGLCGQTPTVVLVDVSGAPVAPALTWQDTRATSEARELAHLFGDPEVIFGTALPWSAVNVPAKLLWLSRFAPEDCLNTRWVLQPKDFIGMALTGSPASDPWCSKGLCRVTDGAPVGEVLEACGWSTKCCPPMADAWSVRGIVSEAAAARFGLPSGVPVSVGWSDALSQTLAAGCFNRSSAFMFSGTSSIVGSPVCEEGARAEGLFSVPKTCAPCALLFGPTQSSGASIEWVARILGCAPADIPALAATARGSIPTFVPYLAGERTPIWNDNVRALLLGLSDSHGRAEIARAVVLGVFLSARHVLDVVEQATAQAIEEVDVVGRGVGDPAWEAIALNAMRVPLRFHEDPDMSVRGATMLAAAASGVDLLDASRQLSDSSRLIRPDSSDVEASKAMLSVYRRAGEIALGWTNERAIWEEGYSWFRPA